MLDSVLAIKSLRAFNNLPSEFRKIVFYAEDSQSQNFISDLVKEISLKLDHKISYLTSDPDDTIFIEAKIILILMLFISEPVLEHLHF